MIVFQEKTISIYAVMFGYTEGFLGSNIQAPVPIMRRVTCFRDSYVLVGKLKAPLQ
jgi:hypothetical protein